MSSQSGCLKRTEQVFKAILLIAFFGFICYLSMQPSTSQLIEAHPGKTICKYVDCEPTKNSSWAYVKYYVDDSLYINKAGSCPDDDDATDKFYVLHYSTTDPNNALADFTEEVTDTVLTNELERKLQFKYWFYHQK